MGHAIKGPNPQYCNLHLAIAQVYHACGAADIVAKLYGNDGDSDSITLAPTYFGGPFVSDDVLYTRLEERLAHSVSSLGLYADGPATG
jgi:hypothetical protein